MNTQTESSAIDKPEKALRRHRLYWLLAMAFIYGFANALAWKYTQFLPLSFFDREATSFWFDLTASSPRWLQQVYSLIFSFEFWAFCLIFLLRFVAPTKILLFGLWLILLNPLSIHLLAVISFSMLTYLVMVWSDRRCLALNIGLVMGTYYVAQWLGPFVSSWITDFVVQTIPQVPPVLDQVRKVALIVGVVIIAFSFTLLWKSRPDTASIPAQKFRPIFRKRYLNFYLIQFLAPLRAAAYTAFYSGVVTLPYGSEMLWEWSYILPALGASLLAFPIYGFMISKFGERRILIWEAIAFLVCTLAYFTAAAPIAALLTLLLPFSTLAFLASLSHLKRIVLTEEIAGTTLMLKTLMTVFSFIGISLAAQTMESKNTIGLVAFFVVAMAVWLAFVWRLPDEEKLEAQAKQATV